MIVTVIVTVIVIGIMTVILGSVKPTPLTALTGSPSSPTLSSAFSPYPPLHPAHPPLQQPTTMVLLSSLSAPRPLPLHPRLALPISAPSSSA